MDFAFQIILALVPILTLIAGYYLGLRSQKQQTLHEYVINIVKKEYPELFKNIRFNSVLLDDWLSKPYEDFSFSKVLAFFDEGLDSLMRAHHLELYVSKKELHDEVVPSLAMLNKLYRSLWTGLVKTWGSHLKEKLPESYKGNSNLVVGDLAGSINEFNVLPDLLIGDKTAIMNKLRGCLSKWEFGGKGATNEDRAEFEETIDMESLTEDLVKIAEPSVKQVISLYQQLRTQNENLIKKSLLPLFQKYIAQPI
jgi:hypothetical protein